MSTLADGFTLGNNINQAFTTSDDDNDNRKASNCATDFSGGNFLNSSWVGSTSKKSYEKKQMWKKIVQINQIRKKCEKWKCWYVILL